MIGRDNGRLRDECLSGHWFPTLDEAKRLVEADQSIQNAFLESDLARDEVRLAIDHNAEESEIRAVAIGSSMGSPQKAAMALDERCCGTR